MKNLRSLGVAIVLTVLGLVYAQPVEVVWWDFLGGGDGVRMKALIDEFNATHDDIQINGTTLDWGVPYYTKVQTSVAVGESPDIMTYHLSRFPSAVPQGLLRPFSEEELAGVGLSLGDYFEGEIEKATVDGQVYGIPLDIHAIVLYYNKEILGSVGLLDENGLPAGFDGLDNFNAAMQKIKDEAGVIPLSIEHGSGTAWRIFY
ncbi:MAG: extracellular solute-binding protein, partial [Desulfuromonadales bacterium]|nr:extracellular solute-binding protein [Desulfuromonadales bacterium]NIS40299.1 extracellular solute-binding protein [Desulfuromonadales bacterium]